MSNVNSFESVLKFLGTKARSYEDVTYEPTFKSSAMFPIMCGGDISAHLTFMNYWKHKSGIEPVSCLMTLRSRQGGTLKRDYFKIEQDVYSFKFPELVSQYLDADGTFVGSCEFEINSVEDLKYPYPAISVIYETSQGVAAVHMGSRAFHSISDMDQRKMEDVQESGFDIFSTDTLTPYLCFTNGSRPVEQAKMIFTAFNSEGAEKSLDIRCEDLRPYETVFVLPDERFELKEFLKDKVGFCKVKYDSFGIFPRLLCGNISRDYSQMSITHSYYDVSVREEYFNTDTASNTRGAFRAIPLLFDREIEVDLNFYPIYSPEEVSLKARIYDPSGALLADIDDIGSITSPGNKMLSLSMKEVIQKAEVPHESSALLSIECSTQSGRMPTRINYGVNYHSPARIGTNINISMHQNPEFIAKKGTFRWLPILLRNDLSNLLLVSVLSNKISDDFVASVKLNIFSAMGKLHSQEISLKNQTTVTLQIEDILAGIDHHSAEDEVLWCTLESENPYVTAYYLIKSTQGCVGGDHSF